MSAVTTGAMLLTEVRARAATALAPAEAGDPDVHIDYPDAVEPPALMILWADPWLEPEPLTISRCQWEAHLEVLCIASRVEPGPGIEKLEELVLYTIGRLAADEYRWPAARVANPGIFYPGGVPFLGARVLYDLRVDI